jgi:hypothetical protein
VHHVFNLVFVFSVSFRLYAHVPTRVDTASLVVHCRYSGAFGRYRCLGIPAGAKPSITRG